MIIDFQNLNMQETKHYLQHAVAPRPICFASTINKEGKVNLSPFSFFNIFSVNPPVVVFSPSRSGKTSTLKDTFIDITQIPEVGINMVDYSMVHQMNHSSVENTSEANKFYKKGFTMQKSEIIQPPLVRESKIKMECRVTDINELGYKGGSGILVIAEVLKMHLSDEVLDEDGHIDPLKTNHVARMGGDWYINAKPAYMFSIPKPSKKLKIGVENLPHRVIHSKILTGNHLTQLANVSDIPAWNENFDDPVFNENSSVLKYETRIAQLLDNNKLEEAWQVLLRWSS